MSIKLNDNIKQEILMFLDLQHQSYQKSLNNKLLNSRVVRSKYKNAREQVELMNQKVEDLIKKVKEL